jgi:hypothetical protein
VPTNVHCLSAMDAGQQKRRNTKAAMCRMLCRLDEDIGGANGNDLISEGMQGSVSMFMVGHRHYVVLTCSFMA